MKYIRKMFESITAIEAGLICALIAVAAIAAMQGVSPRVSNSHAVEVNSTTK